MTAASVAGAYLLVVLGVLVWVRIEKAEDPASFAGLWAIAVTAPLSVVGLVIDDLLGLHGPAGAVAVSIAGAVQAWVIWRIFRGPVTG